MSSESHDVIIIGGGPAGATCATLCARAELRTLVLERAVFPREKVCGDCINPSCWDVLDRLGVSERVLALPHAKLDEVEFISANGHAVSVALPNGTRGEIAVRRALFDDLVLKNAVGAGAEIQQGVAATSLRKNGAWIVLCGDASFRSRVLVAADGRNSLIARLAGLLPATRAERIGVQTHIAAPPGFERRIAL